MGFGERTFRNNEALLLLTAKWLKWKLLGRGWSHAALEFKQGTSALGQGSLAPLQGGCLWPWWRPVLHVASKEYVLGLGLMAVPVTVSDRVLVQDSGLDAGCQ